MVNIAIQGHPTRGKEVIQILKSLGGKNTNHLHGNNCDGYYCILGDNHITSIFSILGHKVYTLEEFEKEFPFKVGDRVVSLTTGLIGTITKFFKNGIYYFKYDNGICSFASASHLKLYKEMKEERNITLTLEKAKEWYKKGGELKEVALQAYSEEELSKVELPKSWENFCDNYMIDDSEGYFDACCTVRSADISCRHPLYDKNVCPSIESAKAHLAMIQLEQLRNCWWNGWEPIWDISEKWCICLWGNELGVEITKNISRFLTFPTRKMAEEFLECFRDLIEKAGDLI